MLKRAVMLLMAVTACGAQDGIDVSVTVDFGRDVGQNFGTLFEARDADGRLTFGAGFAGAYNTYHRAERYKVQFFVRPPANANPYTMEKLPRFSDERGTYVFDLGDGVYARDAKHLYRLDGDQWRQLPPTPGGQASATVRGVVLEWRGGRIYHGDQLVLEPPGDNHRLFRPYYGQGHLCFYHHELDADGKISVNECVAIPWSAYAGKPADWSKAVRIRLLSEKEFPYGWGQFGNEVLNCSNWGALLAFDGKQWKTLVAADMNTSYQIYAMINYRDKLYMAQYPTGFLIEYDGKNVTVMENWPPVPVEASPSAREAQTAMIYRGELLVGVWPWAELWRHDPDSEKWTFMQRMFTHPKTHANPVHAYEQQATAAGLVLNDLGQRLTSMTPTGDGLIIGTSSKGGGTIAPEGMAFLTEEQRDEYGAVYRLHLPGNLAAVVQWKDQPTTLRFVAKDGKMTIYQDGEGIGSGEVDPDLLRALPPTKVQPSLGVYGPLAGTITRLDVNAP